MYKVKVKLSAPTSGEVELGLPVDQLMEAIQKLSPEIVTERDFAYEKAILVDPQSGKEVGGYALEVAEGNLLLNGELMPAKDGSLPGWTGFDPASMEVKSETFGEGSHPALYVEKTTITNSRLAQSVRLKPESWYLLKHWQWRDGSDNPIVVQAVDPRKRLFRRDFSSFIPAYVPPRQWVFSEELLLPRQNINEVEISTAFAGRQGVSAISLESVRWVLRANLPSTTDVLDLYLVGRAGHILTAPSSVRRITKELRKVIPAEIQEAKSRFARNVRGLAADDHFRLWTFPSEYPMREDFLAGLCPPDSTASDPVLRLNTFRGGWVSVPVVVKSGTPTLNVRRAEGKAPFPVKVEKLGLIPVYDGPIGVGKWLQNRFDALIPVQDTGFTPARDGQHVLVVTCHVPETGTAGKYEGTLELEFENQGEIREFSVPIEISVADITLRPQRHFYTILGNEQWKTQQSADLVSPPVTGTAFHGLSAANMSENPEDPANLNPRWSRLGRLVRAYNHVMLDNWLSPQSPSLFVPFSYSIKDLGAGKAPQLGDFHFDQFDEAMKEFVIERDMPWISIHHTNGHLMDSLTLQNGVTYTLRDVPESDRVKRLPEAEYFRLVGDYMEAMATHMNDLGILDRTLLTVDESDPSTYELMLKYRRTLKSRPHAQKIRFLHTAFKTAIFTQRKKDGGRVLEEALDFPAPINDEHFNYFTPGIDWKPENSGGSMWVYYVETDHWNLLNAGLSTVITPLKLTHFGAAGWYCWASFVWSLPYPKKGVEEDGVRFTSGPVENPWVNPFYHHGPGVLSFFYPPDPNGVPASPTEKVIPSYRLYLMRDGLQDVAWQKVLARGVDDAGQKLAVNEPAYQRALQRLKLLWADNPVQWYLGYDAHASGMDEMKKSLSSLPGAGRGAF